MTDSSLVHLSLSTNAAHRLCARMVNEAAPIGDELGLGARIRYASALFTVELVPPEPDSLFHAVLYAGVLPRLTNASELRLALYEFALGAGRPIATRLMTLFSTNAFVVFPDYIRRLLPGASAPSSDFFDVVMLATFAQVNLIVLRRSASALTVFNARQFLAQEVRLQAVPPTPELYLFQGRPDGPFLYLSRQAPASITPPLSARVVADAVPALQRSADIGRRPPPPKRLPSEIVLFNVELGSDYRLLVADAAFFVHRRQLDDSCAAFRAFFQSPLFSQCQQNPRWNGRDIVVQLPAFSDEFGALDDAPAVVFRRFLELIYDLVPIVDVPTPALAGIAVIASKLRSDRLLQRCDVELAGRPLGPVRPRVLRFARRHGLARLHRSQLVLLDAAVVDCFALIGELSERDLTDYLEAATRQTPVTLLTVALIHLCGLDRDNHVRKRGEFFEVAGRRRETCRRWVALCAKRCRTTAELADLYALVRKTRLVGAEGRHDDAALRDAVVLSLTGGTKTLAVASTVAE